MYWSLLYTFRYINVKWIIIIIIEHSSYKKDVGYFNNCNNIILIRNIVINEYIMLDSNSKIVNYITNLEILIPM